MLDDITKKLGYKELSYIGEGGYGTAYLTDDDKVLKITSDENEFLTMLRLFKNQQERLESGQDENSIYEKTIKIYGAWMLDNGQMAMLMEYLDVDGVEDRFNQLMDSESYGLMELFDMDEDNLRENGFHQQEDIEFVFAIADSLFEFRRAGIATDNFDVSPYNIGKNSYGNYVLFDQRQKDRLDISVRNELKDMLKNGDFDILSSKSKKKKRRKHGIN